MTKDVNTPPSKIASYAHDDPDFMGRDELRGARLMLEYLKPELALSDEGVRSTVVIFGSARLTDNCDSASMHPGSVSACQMLFGHYYEEARRFANLISQKYNHSDPGEFVVMTGGGPGIMEAANRGAYDAGARSVGLNIILPHEQLPNPYITPELNFHFRYFGLRKLHFVMRAKALVAFPGGFGTLDELFDVLTLVQTRKIDPIPIILFGGAYWNRVVDFEFLASSGFINLEDLKLFKIVETAEDAIEYICEFKSPSTEKD